MKRSIVAIALVFSIASGLCAAPIDINGGFENTTVRSSSSLTTETVHSGKHALRLTGRANIKFKPVLTNEFTVQLFSTTPLKLTYQSKQECEDATEKSVALKSNTTKGGFTRYFQTVKFNAPTQLLSIGFIASNAIIDDVSLDVTSPPTIDKKKKTSTDELRQIIREAFLAIHEGYSTDEVLLDDRLNCRFIAHCKRHLPNAGIESLNLALLNLRKSGKLGPVVTKRRYTKHDDHTYAAEIAARQVCQKHDLALDRVLCNPKTRKEFDHIAKSAAPDVDPYLLRKAAVGLRKARRLRPQLVADVSKWDQKITTHRADQLIKSPANIPSRPGVYIFSDPTGILYIGESKDLRGRVSKHLDHSDRKALAHYLWKNGVDKITVELHAFDPESKMKTVTVRRAYESQLIAERKPRFNIRP